LILNLLLPEDEEDEVPVVESDPEVELRAAAGAETSSGPEDLKN
jgi:hypothetical protein